MGLPHSFCSGAFPGSRGSDRADEDEISETLDAVEADVDERDRPSGESEGGGSGTESMIVWADLKAFWR